MRSPFAAWTIPLLLVSATPLPAQSLAELTERLAKAETVDGSTVGDGGDKSDTWRAYEKWRSLASVAELREFTKHGNAAVRIYAVRALVEIDAAVDFAAIANERLLDDTEVTTFEGCCKSKQLAGDVVIEALRPKLSAEQVLDLAEALIATPSPLYAREWSLRTLRLRDPMLHPIRTMAERGDAVAAIALARFGLPTDAKILAKLLQTDTPFADNAWFVAAELHHDPSLLTPLLAIGPKARQRLETDNASRLTSWLKALAAQQSPEAGQFLLRFLRETTPGGEFHEKDLLDTYAQALEPYPQCTAFDEVRTELRRRGPARR